MNKRGWIISGATALVLIVSAAAYLLFKLGQQSIWSDYDDYGWS
jgi:hypothetical protein